jgi:putative transcriptional regulator
VTLTAIVVPGTVSGHLRASHADRDQAIEVLKAAFVRERLAKAEFEIRVSQALASRTFADLAAVTDGIPARLVAGQPGTTPARVREQRIQREMSQADLAGALGVSRQTVSLIEGGRYLPSLPLAFAIARFFDLTVDKMFGPAEEQAGAPAEFPNGLAGRRDAVASR